MKEKYKKSRELLFYIRLRKIFFRNNILVEILLKERKSNMERENFWVYIRYSKSISVVGAE